MQMRRIRMTVHRPTYGSEIVGLGNEKRKTRRSEPEPRRREIGTRGARGYPAIPVAAAIAAVIAAGTTPPALAGSRDAARADQSRQVVQEIVSHEMV
jgi:hypothetical protein